MARARNIKPGLFKNELLGVEDPMLSLLFVGLWTLADRRGVLEDRPTRIKGELFPYRNAVDVNGYLTVLERLGFILRYKAAGLNLILINNFTKHQHPHNTEKASDLPAPSEKDFQNQEDVSEPLDNGKNPLDNRYKPADSLFTDPLSTDSIIDAQPVETSMPSVKRKCRIPKDFELTTERIQAANAYWLTKTRTDLSASDEFEKFVNYHLANGKPMLDWDACWRTWCANAVTFNRKAPIVQLEPRGSTFDQLTDTSWAAGMLPEPQ